jgi:hypothetical protein
MELWEPIEALEAAKARRVQPRPARAETPVAPADSTADSERPVPVVAAEA